MPFCWFCHALAQMSSLAATDPTVFRHSMGSTIGVFKILDEYCKKLVLSTVCKIFSRLQI